MLNKDFLHLVFSFFAFVGSFATSGSVADSFATFRSVFGAGVGSRVEI